MPLLGVVRVAGRASRSPKAALKVNARRCKVKGRSRGLQQHKCRACGKSGHRLETCSTKAAKIIRSLMAKLAKTVSAKKGSKKGSIDKKIGKDGMHKQKARLQYSGSLQKRVVYRRDRDTVTAGSNVVVCSSNVV